MKNSFFLILLAFLFLSPSLYFSQTSDSPKFKKVKKLKKKNKELFGYTENIKKSLETHNWDDFISYCLEDNYLAQQEMGIGKEQYIYEMLEIKYKSALDIDVDYIELIHMTVPQIKKVTTTQFAAIGRGMLGDSYLFKGSIELENGQIATFQYELLLLNKSFKLIGAVG